MNEICLFLVERDMTRLDSRFVTCAASVYLFHTGKAIVDDKFRLCRLQCHSISLISYKYL